MKKLDDHTDVIKKAWRNWLLIFVPLFAVGMAANYWFGFYAILPLLIVMLVVTLLYQRVVKKRTWRSIMWGVYASNK